MPGCNVCVAPRGGVLLAPKRLLDQILDISAIGWLEKVFFVRGKWYQQHMLYCFMMLCQKDFQLPIQLQITFAQNKKESATESCMCSYREISDK